MRTKQSIVLLLALALVLTPLTAWANVYQLSYQIDSSGNLTHLNGSQRTALVSSGLPDLSIEVGSKRTITLQTSPANASLSASSSNSEVAEAWVSGSALHLSAISQGSATITVMAHVEGMDSGTKAFQVAVYRPAPIVVTPPPTPPSPPPPPPPPPIVDKSALNTAITSAQALHNGAVEGTNPGQYAIGSKAVFQTAIDAAKAVSDNQSATAQQVSQATTSLAAARTIFLSSMNAAYGDACQPGLAYNSADDEFLLVYVRKEHQQPTMLYGKLVNSSGSAGPEFLIAPNVDVSWHADPPAVVYASSLNQYLVVYNERIQPTSAIKGQFISSTGSLLSNFSIAEGTFDDYLNQPSIAYDSNNNRFMVAWRFYSQVADMQYEIEGIVLNADGSPYSQRTLLVTAFWSQYLPQPTFVPSTGEFLLSYIDSNDIYGLRINSDGQPNGNRIQIQIWDYTTRQQTAYNSTAGQSLVVFNMLGNIYGRYISPTGEVGSEFAICTAPGEQLQERVVAIEGTGQFFVIWHDERGGGSDKGQVYGRLVGPGTFLGNEVQLVGLTNVATSYWYVYPSLAYSPSAQKVLIAYTDGTNAPQNISLLSYPIEVQPLCFVPDELGADDYEVSEDLEPADEVVEID